MQYRVKPLLTDAELKPLFRAAWPHEDDASYEPVLARSLTYVAAYDMVGGGEQLVGFVNVAWDGGDSRVFARHHGSPGGAAAWGRY